METMIIGTCDTCKLERAVCCNMYDPSKNPTDRVLNWQYCKDCCPYKVQHIKDNSEIEKRQKEAEENWTWKNQAEDLINTIKCNNTSNDYQTEKILEVLELILENI